MVWKFWQLLVHFPIGESVFTICGYAFPRKYLVRGLSQSNCCKRKLFEKIFLFCVQLKDNDNAFPSIFHSDLFDIWNDFLELLTELLSIDQLCYQYFKYWDGYWIHFFTKQETDIQTFSHFFPFWLYSFFTFYCWTFDKFSCCHYLPSIIIHLQEYFM